MTIRIVTDSTSDLPDEIVAHYGLTVVPTVINIGNESYLDGKTLSRQQFYDRLPTLTAHPSTAAPAPGEFAQLFNRLADEGATAIIAIMISTDLSAFYNSARLGAAEITRIPVTMIDSRTTSMGLGLLVIMAAQAIGRGQSAEEVVALIRRNIPKTRVYAAADTLDYLRRSGRVSGFAASIGSLLSLKPILEVKDGFAKSFDRVRTRKKVADKFVEILRGLGEVQSLAIVHANAEDHAQELNSIFAQQFGIIDPIVCTIGPAIGTHIGPGLVGFACIMK